MEQRRKTMYRYNEKLANKITDSYTISDALFNENMISHLEDNHQKAVLDFINKIKSKNPYWNFNILYQNLPTLKIEENYIKTTFIGASACYDWKRNIIYYKHLKDIFHELIHVSTFRTKGNIYLCGFNQAKKGIFGYDIGRGLNEGYANLLEEKYNKCFSWYVMEHSIVRNLDMTFNQMETFYNEANLNAMINLMGQNEARKDILDFIQKLDYINKYQKDTFKKVQREIIALYYECQLYTYRNFIYKLLNDIDSNKVTFDDANLQLRKMIILSPSKIFLGEEEKIHEVKYLIDLKNNIPDMRNIKKEDKQRLKLKV